MHPSDPTVPLLIFDGDMSPPPPAPLPCAANAQETQYNSAAGGVNWRKWNGIGGTGVQQLLDAQVVGGAGADPDDSATMDIFEAPVNICNNCGTEMDGWFKAAAATTSRLVCRRRVTRTSSRSLPALPEATSS